MQLRFVEYSEHYVLSQTGPKQAAEHLLVKPPPTSQKRKASADEVVSSSAGKKQKSGRPEFVSRFKNCFTCHQVFDSTENTKVSCITHLGTFRAAHKCTLCELT
jgi:hypothetical protein